MGLGTMRDNFILQLSEYSSQNGMKLIFQIVSCRSELNYCKYDNFCLKAMLIDVAVLNFLMIIDKQFGSGLK